MNSPRYDMFVVRELKRKWVLTFAADFNDDQAFARVIRHAARLGKFSKDCTSSPVKFLKDGSTVWEIRK